jgi:DNA-binding CsgD family transcriptional regulator
LLIHPAFAETAAQGHDKRHDGGQVELSETELRILRALEAGPKSLPEIAAGLGYQGRTGHLRKALEKLADEDLVVLTLPATPRSKNQKRRLTTKGRKMFARLKTATKED